jgi:hypothetical protein
MGETPIFSSPSRKGELFDREAGSYDREAGSYANENSLYVRGFQGSGCQSADGRFHTVCFRPPFSRFLILINYRIIYSMFAPYDGTAAVRLHNVVQ